MEAPDTSKFMPLDGNTTVDAKMVFQSECLSYKSVELIAQTIASTVKSKVIGNTVVVVGTPFLSDLSNLQAVLVMLDQLKRDYEALNLSGINLTNRKNRPMSPAIDFDLAGIDQELVPRIANIAFNPGSTAINSSLGIVSMFKEDVQYNGIRTVVNPLAFELVLAAKINEVGATKVFVPDVVVPQPLSDPGSFKSKLEAVQKAKAEVWETVSPLISELMQMEVELDRAVNEKNQELVDQYSLGLALMRRALDPLSDPLTRLDQRFTDLETEWSKTEAETGLSMLARWLRAESIKAMNPIYLHAQVILSGGHNRICRNLLRLIFLGDGLRFMGGATVRWALLENDSSISSGGIISERMSESFPSWFRELFRFIRKLFFPQKF